MEGEEVVILLNERQQLRLDAGKLGYQCIALRNDPILELSVLLVIDADTLIDDLHALQVPLLAGLVQRGGPLVHHDISPGDRELVDAVQTALHQLVPVVVVVVPLVG